MKFAELRDFFVGELLGRCPYIKLTLGLYEEPRKFIKWKLPT